MTADAKLIYADRQLGKFIRQQYENHLGYPRMSAFARDIARGTIGLPPVTEEEPEMIAVGRFYHGLLMIEKSVLCAYYAGIGGSIRQKAKRLGQSRARFYRILNRLRRSCAYAIESP